MKAKPRIYSIPIELPLNTAVPPVVPIGQFSQGSVTIQNMPFILRRVTFGLLTQNGLWAPGVPPVWTDMYLSVPDGMFTLKLYSTDIIITPDPVPAQGAFGGIAGQDWLDLPAPVEFKPKDVITAELRNLVLRNAAIVYAILLHGVEPLETPRATT